MKRFLIEAICEIADEAGQPMLRAEAEDQVDLVFAALRKALERGAPHVTIPGFGRFTRQLQPARRVRDPRNGERVMSRAKHKIKFKEARIR